MQSLLSPSESHAFQSFLSSMDIPDDPSVSAAEWAMYTSSGPMQDDLLGETASQNPEHREALTKATKDLMSLDADRWQPTNNYSMDHRQEMSRQVYDMQGNLLDGRQDHLQGRQHHHIVHQPQQGLQQYQHQQPLQGPFSQNHANFPFLQMKHPQQHQQRAQHLPSPLVVPAHLSQHRPSLHVTPPTASGSASSRPIRTSQNQLLASHSPVASTSTQSATASSSSSNHNHHYHLNGVAPSPSNSSSSSSTPFPNGRASAHVNVNGVHPGSSSRSGPGAATGARTSKRTSRAAASAAASQASPPTNPSLSGGATSTSVAHGPSGSGPAPKQQALLSPSQKKANHIQSEQKRRANIRRGYEALCETVPALREAIREEEEEMERSAAGSTVAGGGKTTGAAGKKKARGKKGQGKEEEKERIDGRAGPRSENVVLSKTIDHIESLLADRSALLARLHRARSSLPPGHPALSALVPDPPWEREWRGGEGRLGGEGEGEGEGEEGSESDE